MIGVRDSSALLPFIHLFKTPQSFYFYDVNRNESVKIEESVYETLLSEQKFVEESCDALVLDKLKNLKAQGYLKTNRPKVLRHPETDNLSLYLERNLNLMILQLTQSCNFRCSYCPYSQEAGLTRKHTEKHMSWNTAKQAIDFLYLHSVDSSSISIAFYGGEPLVNFQLLKQCVEYVHSNFDGKEQIFSITTNGTLFDQEICTFLEIENFSVTVSLDGVRETNDRNRKFRSNADKSTFDVVIENLKLISEQYSKLFKNISINMVMDPSIPFAEYKNLMSEYPFLRKTLINAVVIDDTLSKEKNMYSFEFQEQYTYDLFLSYLLSVGKYDFIEELTLMRRIIGSNVRLFTTQATDETLGEINIPSGPCIPAKHRMFVDVNGDIFPCEKVSEAAFNTIGNIYNGFNLEKASAVLNYANISFEECRNCFAFRECDSCVRLCINGMDGDQAERIKNCEYIRSNTHRNLVLRAIHREFFY